MNTRAFAVAAVVQLAALSAPPAAGAAVERIWREARLTRGNTNVARVQPVDDASWIWLPGDSGRNFAVLRFRCEFDVAKGDGELVFDVSADERYYLTLDGEFVSRGPNRGSVENWQYQTYKAKALAEGRHVMEATVWRLGDNAPLAQLSWRGGFVLKAEGAYDAKLTTGRAAWQVGRVDGLKPIGSGNGVWGTGAEFECAGPGLFVAKPSKWSRAAVVRGPAGLRGGRMLGHRTGGWMLFASQLPDQTERVFRCGEFRAATHDAKWRARHDYTAAETNAPEVAGLNAVLDYATPFTVPPHTRLQAAWDLFGYVCAYPVLRTKGGARSRVSWTWTESTRNAGDRRKGNRAEIVGKYLDGYGDVFLPDGGECEFTTPWFRCGRWCRLDVETGDEPLVIAGLEMIESRYPLEVEGGFSAPDDPTIPDITRICTRAIEMCCHEMLFDCPYYEQQMYPGDSRIQMNVLAAMTRDDRMTKRAIEIFDLATRDDGMCPMNYPTRGVQESGTYTLCYLLMFGDYAMNHADREWLRARLPGMRKSMAAMELCENADGLLENVPGWCFIDWATGWNQNGTPPGAQYGEGVNAEVNLFWSLAMKSAATVESALGNDLQAEYWLRRREALSRRIVERFWCEERGLLADTPAARSFSEHAQALAIVGDVLPPAKAETAFRHLVGDPDLVRTTVYFDYYLFEAFFKMGRGDLFLKRLDLWREYVDLGVTTLLECPDTGKNGQNEARSDCHAWGAHPLWYMSAGLAGIKPAAPFFERVEVAPCPGGLAEVIAARPHPAGMVEVDLKFEDGKAHGTVDTPVPGVFRYGGFETILQKGVNKL